MHLFYRCPLFYLKLFHYFILGVFLHYSITTFEKYFPITIHFKSFIIALFWPKLKHYPIILDPPPNRPHFPSPCYGLGKLSTWCLVSFSMSACLSHTHAPCQCSPDWSWLTAGDSAKSWLTAGCLKLLWLAGSSDVGGPCGHVTTYYKSLVCKSGVDVARGSNMSANKLKYFFSFSLPNLMVSSWVMRIYLIDKCAVSVSLQFDVIFGQYFYWFQHFQPCWKKLFVCQTSVRPLQT